MLILVASLMLAQPVPPVAGRVIARSLPSLRELAWRADAVVLGSVLEGKAGAVELIEVLSGEAGTPGKLIPIPNVAEAGWAFQPGAEPQWRWILLFLAKNPKNEDWRILPGGWRGSTGGEQIFEPDLTAKSPVGVPMLTWDTLMGSTRSDLRSAAALRAVLSVPAGARDPGVLDWIGRNCGALQNRHPESVWPGASTAALEALYSSPIAASRWAAARIEKRAEPNLAFKRGEPFAQPEALDYLVEILAKSEISSVDVILCLEAIAAGMDAGGKPFPSTMETFARVLPEKARDKSTKIPAISAMLSITRRMDALLPGQVREKWLEAVLEWYGAEKQGPALGLLARLLVALGGPEAYEKAKGNPRGVILLVEDLVADSTRLKGILRQAGTAVGIQEKPVFRFERLDAMGKVVATKDDLVVSFEPAEWRAGWAGPGVVPFSLETRGLEAGRWKLTIRAKRAEVGSGNAGGAWWVSEPWIIQCKGKNPAGQPEAVPLVVNPEIP